MRQNIGSFDRILRVLLAALILVLLWQQQRTGSPLLLWVPVAVVLLGTGLLGYCPFYGLLGISTRRGSSI